ncbi:MAG: DUF2147 domain-containing protein [Fulvimarina manganoxydans]|uniref:DUF2147 domain-containing protein n=1 Tax=Fulvimarina manganoxydans TaxID=937218 RepID=UPI002353AC40|nr:DUF2147 domain-containing protein [Fulvimarina manganoxydans]MCK5932851.1 DUF2147 domain-containing protein [Fulvimarina manganoxydans]MEE2951293.1 DUF2147 domain-containing protein [Pseudomonadota bacterium]
MMTGTRSAIAAAALLAASSLSAAASPMVGTWRGPDGAEIKIAQCSAGLCATVASGPYRGAPVAEVSGSGPKYSGRVHDPRSGESYTGALVHQGNQIALEGCLMEVFCKTVQQWSRID